MITRCLASFLLLCLATAALGSVSSAAAQAPASASGEWVVARTPDGHPDLQGNWSSATLTPFERPEGQEPLLTWAEVEELEGRVAGRLERVSQASDPDRPAPPVGGTGAGGGVGGYNGIYIDWGDRVAVVTEMVQDCPTTCVPGWVIRGAAGRAMCSW